MVSRLDMYVGQVIDRLQENGILGNTVIIFASDNGPHIEGGADPEFFDSNGIFRGIKRDLYEGGIRVPFIIAWEGVVSPGSENRDAFVFWDLYPTFRDILSRTGDGSRRKTQDTADKCADGISILPALTGTGRQRHHKMLYFEFHEDGGRQAVISGDMKLIKLHASSENGQIWELYDLKNDPSETVNLLDAEHTSARYRKIAARLRKIMQQEHVADPVWPLLDCELRQAQAN